jgi:glycosyltransferase involved in cell wall biosynthesis
LKICVFYNLPPGGAKRLAYSCARGLRNRGHFIDLVTTDTQENELFSIRPFAHQVLEYQALMDRSIKRFKPYVLWRYLEFLRKACFMWTLRACHKRMASEMQGRGYDLIFVHACVHTQSPFLLRYLTAPTIYYSNEPLRIVYDESPKESIRSRNPLIRATIALCKPAEYFEKLLLKRVDRTNIRSAPHVLTSSEHTRNRLFRAYGISSTVCYPGIENDRFRPLYLKRKDYVLSVGTIAPNKRHDFVINALAGIEAMVRPRLVIVANFVIVDCLEQVRDLAVKQNVDLAIKILVPEEELVRTYNEARAVIYTPEQEPFGLVPLEAMACGTPVIGVREGGIPETIKDGCSGILIGRNEQECTVAIERILWDDNLCRQLGQSGPDYVRRCWSLEGRTRELEAALTRIKQKCTAGRGEMGERSGD